MWWLGCLGWNVGFLLLTSYLTLGHCLSFLICKMGLIMAPWIVVTRQRDETYKTLNTVSGTW